MSQELIIWILSASLGFLDIGAFVVIGIHIIKGVSKRVSESTNLKSEVAKLNKNLAKSVELNQKLLEQNEAMKLELRGFKNGNVGIHREIKK